jgi:glycosyltransferase involved in cell wall biosynthesis
LSFCKEHIILDGGSSDGTVELARQYSCTVIPQDMTCLNAESRIVDYGGITNQGITAASQPWVVILSADEEIDEELMEAIKKNVRAGTPKAFLFNRIVTVEGGRRVLHASAYPSQQIRLFHKDTVQRFVKRIHEKPLLAPGVTPLVLPGIQFVPFGDTTSMRRKHTRYLWLELTQLGPKQSGIRWIGFAWSRIVRILYRTLRMIGQRLRYRWSTCMPLRYEWIDIRYPFLLMLWSFPAVRRRILQEHAADLTPQSVSPAPR